MVSLAASLQLFGGSQWPRQGVAGPGLASAVCRSWASSPANLEVWGLLRVEIRALSPQSHLYATEMRKSISTAHPGAPEPFPTIRLQAKTTTNLLISLCRLHGLARHLPV